MQRQDLETQEANNSLLTQLSRLKLEPPDDKQGLATEGMRVIIQQENERRMQNGEPPLNCRVIDAKDFPALLNQSKDMQPQHGNLRMQVIVRDERHYTMMDMQFSSNGNKCILLDAAGDLRAMNYAGQLLDAKGHNQELLFDNVYFPRMRPGVGSKGNPQKDFYSCPIFSLDHAMQTSRMDNIYDQLGAQVQPGKGDAQLPHLYWDNLPPQLIWNAQSRSMLNEYMEQHPEASNQTIPGVGMSMAEYVDANKGEVTFTDKKTGEEKHTMGNLATQRLFESYSAQAKGYVDSNSPETIQQVTSGATGRELASALSLPAKVDSYAANNRTPENESRNAAIGSLQQDLAQRSQDGITPVSAAPATQAFSTLRELDRIADRMSDVSTHYQSKSHDQVKEDLAQEITSSVQGSYQSLDETISGGYQKNPQACVDTLKENISSIGARAQQHHQQKHPIKHKMGTLKQSRLEKGLDDNQQQEEDSGNKFRPGN